MPKKVTEANSKDKWNFYFPRLLKLEMCHKLLDMDLQNKQSALLRALVRLFVEGAIDETRLRVLIQEETYITPTNRISKL
jgi:hypothetical protein